MFLGSLLESSQFWLKPVRWTPSRTARRMESDSFLGIPLPSSNKKQRCSLGNSYHWEWYSACIFMLTYTYAYIHAFIHPFNDSICECTYIYICIHTNIYIYMCIYIQTQYTHVWIFTCMVCIDSLYCVQSHKYTRIHASTQMFTSLSLSVYIYIYTETHIPHIHVFMYT